MTACESSGFTGASSLDHKSSHIIHRISAGCRRWCLATFIINNILFLADVKMISSPRQNRCWLLALFCRRVWPDPKKGPFSVLFLSVTLICVSPHIGKAKAAFGSWMSLILTRYPGDIGWNPPLFPRLAQVQSAVKSLSFLYSLWIRMVDYGYMCMIHERTAVRSSADPAARRSFFHRREAASAPVNRSGRRGSYLCGVTLDYFCPLFSLRIVHWDR